MARQLKRWESPRSQGRNIKGKGGSARARQLKKQRQTLRNKLNQNQSNGKDQLDTFPIFLEFTFPLNVRTNRGILVIM
uniref:Uncharacterized protein n=1 Tax=Planktothrix pseudagardhii TaxID=132604 RepID=A0A9W4CN20_9CYAN|nr:hypothetical protein NO713_03270 [Planktothrix pseudagardhii]